MSTEPQQARAAVDTRLVRAAGICGAAFVVLAALVWTGSARLLDFDRTWAARAYDFALEQPWCEAIARGATWAGGAVVVTIVTILAVLCCVVRRRWTMSCWLALAVAGSAAANSLVKNVLERTRPSTAALEASAHGFSFPSGHSQAATVTYVAVVLVVGWELWPPTRRLRLAGVTLVVGLIGAVGLSRILLGAHWPSDVLGGWLLGSAWITVATVMLRRVQRRRARAIEQVAGTRS